MDFKLVLDIIDKNLDEDVVIVPDAEYKLFLVFVKGAVIEGIGRYQDFVYCIKNREEVDDLISFGKCNDIFKRIVIQRI